MNTRAASARYSPLLDDLRRSYALWGLRPPETRGDGVVLDLANGPLLPDGRRLLVAARVGEGRVHDDGFSGRVLQQSDQPETLYARLSGVAMRASLDPIRCLEPGFDDLYARPPALSAEVGAKGYAAALYRLTWAMSALNLRDPAAAQPLDALTFPEPAVYHGDEGCAAESALGQPPQADGPAVLCPQCGHQAMVEARRYRLPVPIWRYPTVDWGLPQSPLLAWTLGPAHADALAGTMMVEEWADGAILPVINLSKGVR